MPKRSRILPALYLILSGVLLAIQPGCTSVRGDESLHQSPLETQQRTADFIKSALGPDARELTVRKLKLARVNQTLGIYERNGYHPVWSHQQQWLSTADSLFSFIREARHYGLFPEDYHFEEIKWLRDKIAADTVHFEERSNPLLWSNADLMFTDALMGLLHDIRLGRIAADSLTDGEFLLADSSYVFLFDRLQQGTPLSALMHSLEPDAPGYRELKRALPAFVKKMETREFTRVPSVRSDPSFKKLLQRRLYEGGFLALDSVVADSVTLAGAVKKFQEKNGLTVDGIAGEGTIRMLNTNDRERFIRIAISLDKYKQLPRKMPERYVWVNASANHLKLVENGEVKLYSRVICGKPRTRTPLLSSEISELITYPQWVPPPSIVSKEILPAVKKDPSYLRKKGFSLVDREGNEVDPDSVNWAAQKRMPYRVVQGSGDANALGIMKFVFANKYSVYLHDTNQRYLFGNAYRSLSHGCVRVQEWDKLAGHIIQWDTPGEKGRARVDSMNQWLKRKVKRSIPIHRRLPVFIRYFTCEGVEGGIAFYDDIYGEDRYLREKFFAGK